MNELKLFNFNDARVRAVAINDEPWFVGRDAARALGYVSTRDALAKRVDDEDKTYGVAIRDTMGREQKPLLINESGLYSLIFSSKLPEAKAFKRWVTSEVLPALRKTGTYNLPKTYSEALRELANAADTNEKLILENSELKPKARLADAISASETSILVADMAKILKQNGMDIGERRLFNKLREDGYLMKRSASDWNMPTQRSMELGLMEVDEKTYTAPDGNVYITKTTRITGKGQLYFINKYCD